MDGCFVPNISMGVPVLRSLRKATDLFLDVHLMIDRPLRYVDAFCKAGADLVNFHVEADTEENLLLAIEKARALGRKDTARARKIRAGARRECRGKGYGKELIRQTIDYARKNLNATSISLGVFKNNPPALHCYESIGFKEIGHEAYSIDGDTWEVIEMKLLS